MDAKSGFRNQNDSHPKKQLYKLDNFLLILEPHGKKAKISKISPQQILPAVFDNLLVALPKDLNNWTIDWTT